MSSTKQRNQIDNLRARTISIPSIAAKLNERGILTPRGIQRDICRDCNGQTEILNIRGASVRMSLNTLVHSAAKTPGPDFANVGFKPHPQPADVLRRL